jgi:hypothetical protein
MPMSTAQSTANLNVHLSKIAASYASDQAQFIADTVAPVLSKPGLVTGQLEYDNNEWAMNSDAVELPDDRPANLVDQERPTLLTFQTTPLGLREFISERYLAMRRQAGYTDDQIREKVVKRLTAKLLMDKEQRFLNIATTAGNYNANLITNIGAGNSFDEAGGDPVAVFGAARRLLSAQGADVGNLYAVAEYAVWDVIRHSPQLIIAGWGTPDMRRQVSDDEIFSILGVRPVVTNVRARTRNVATLTSLISDNVVIFQRPPTVSPTDEEALCAWRTITGGVTGTAEPYVVEYEGADMPGRGYYIEVRMEYVHMRTGVDAAGLQNRAALITNALLTNP